MGNGVEIQVGGWGKNGGIKWGGNMVKIGEIRLKWERTGGIPAVAENQYFNRSTFPRHASTFLDNYSQLPDQFRQGVENFWTSF